MLGEFEADTSLGGPCGLREQQRGDFRCLDPFAELLGELGGLADAVELPHESVELGAVAQCDDRASRSCPLGRPACG